jgi:MYXO-CTERM domain-containing protein
VWFDGEQVVTAAAAKTLADGNPHFAQIGLLRGNVDYDGVPVIYIDDVVEGDAIEDVDPADPPGGSESSGGEGTSDEGGLDSSDGGPGDLTTGGPGSTGGGPAGSEDDGPSPTTTDAGSGSTGPAGADGGEGSGCGCRTRSEPASAWWLLALGLVARRRSR